MTAPLDPGGVRRLSPWQARLLHRATRVDIAYCAALLLLAALAIGSGNLAARHLSPEGARNMSALLDELELPRLLPNAALARDDGVATRLWELTSAPRTILTFYAPWCAPCQEELPVLVAATKAAPERLAVVVGAEEDPAEVRRQLANLGLQDLRFHIDQTRELQTGARVSALPATFLLGRRGRVHERVVGNAGYRLHALVYKASGSDASFPVVDGD